MDPVHDPGDGGLLDPGAAPAPRHRPPAPGHPPPGRGGQHGRGRQELPQGESKAQAGHLLHTIQLDVSTLHVFIYIKHSENATPLDLLPKRKAIEADILCSDCKTNSRR